MATDPVNPLVKVPKPGIEEKPFDQYFDDELMSPGVPEVDCNDTKTNIYTSCYAACQSVAFQNRSAGGNILTEVFEVHVCKYGCATDVQADAMKRWKGGAMQLDFLCNCRWDRSVPRPMLAFAADARCIRLQRKICVTAARAACLAARHGASCARVSNAFSALPWRVRRRSSARFLRYSQYSPQASC